MGMLIDLTKCIGCRACQVACKQWNGLPAARTRFNPGFTSPPTRNAYTWTTVERLPCVSGDRQRARFVKIQCLHCEQPACVQACLGGALQKTEAGPVIVNRDQCVGCLHCTDACPYGIPRHLTDRAVPKMQKCSMCADRLAAGLQPACAATCPTGAILFGERSELLQVAHERIAVGQYRDCVYGEQPGCGSSVLYLSDVPLNLSARSHTN